MRFRKLLHKRSVCLQIESQLRLKDKVCITHYTAEQECMCVLLGGAFGGKVYRNIYPYLTAVVSADKSVITFFYCSLSIVNLVV